MPDMNSLQDWVGAILTGIGSAATTFFFVRRKYSQDTTAIVQDKAQGQLITTLIAERDAAMRSAKEAWDQRTADAKAIARFEALMEAGERETKRLRDEIFALRLHTRKLTAIIVRLDPQAAQMLQLDSNGDGIDLEDRRHQGPDTVSHS